MLPFNGASSPKSNTRLDELNDKVELLVQNKEYAEALSFCNAELQKTHAPSTKRFLAVNKARIFAKQHLFLDSIPLILSLFEPVLTKQDSLDLYLNARSLEILGHYYFLTRDVDACIKLLERADSAYAMSTSYANRVYNLNMLGTIYQKFDDLSSALLALLKADELLVKNIPSDTALLIDL